MVSRVKAGRFAGAALAALMFSGCDREPLEPVKDEPPTVPADDTPATIVPPSPTSAANGKTSNMTSYEVAIAIAAANRKKAETDCKSRPTADRRTCLANVATDWNTTRTALEDLRGDSQ